MNSDISERIKIIQELNKNLLVSASAGSGKTTILVERMVALVEEGKISLSKMAALTFTKKAAGEFYDRFYKKLQLRIKPDFDKAKHDKYSLLPPPTKDTIERDKIALANIDTCFFGTIDAYYQKILNEHPLEAGLSSSATIIDDDEFNKYLIKKFSGYLKCSNNEIREKAEFFANNIKASDFPELISGILSHNELDIYQIPDTFASLYENYIEFLDDFKKGCKVLVDNESLFRPLKDDLSDITAKNKEKWELLKTNIGIILNLKDDDFKTANRVFKKLEKLRFNDDTNGLLISSNFLSNCATTMLVRNKPCGMEIKNRAYEQINKIYFKQTVDFLNLVKPDIYNSMIKEGRLTFSLATDCLLKLLRNVKENKSTIELIRSKIDCLLIDECQDTDMKQYEIFFRLTASDYKDDFKDLTIKGGKLYACGDRKQGIYHFRGADVSTYDYIKTIFEEKKMLGLPYDLVTLTDNHRSKGKLIDYFNNTFSDVLSTQGYSPILNVGVNPGEEHFGAFYYDTDKESDPKNVANIILSLHKKEGYSFSDFMVITSSKDKITNYSKAFSALSIPSYSEGKIDIHVSSLLDVIVNLFKYIGSNRSDKISYLEVLSSPLFGFDITRSIDMDFDYLATIGVSPNKVAYPSDLLESLASNEKVIKALNCKGIDVLIGFVHLLKEMENSGEIYSYNDAISYFEDLQNEEIIVERLSLLANNINAVQIANAHKTKGLEKKVVILTNASNSNKGPSIFLGEKYYLAKHEAKSGKNSYPIFTNPNLEILPLKDYYENEKEYLKEENKRLLYVAATRAREYLFIANQVKDGAPVKTSKWYSLLSSSKDVNSFKIDDSFNVSQNIIEYNATKKDYIFNKQTPLKFVSPSKQNVSNKFNEEYEMSLLTRTDALVFGSMVHKLMENIVKAKESILDDDACSIISDSFQRPDLLDSLIKVKNNMYSGGYSQKECPFIDLVKFVKDKKCFVETPVCYKVDDKIVYGVIDLIIETDNKVIIVDYKTDTNDVDHSSQLRYYKDALALIPEFNNKQIETYIYLITKE